METTVLHQSSSFTKLDGINTQAATPSETSVENVKHALSLGLPKLHQHPFFQKVKGKDKKIALVGGGPSVKNYIEDIKQYKNIFACGSSNDWLMENGIIPTYAAICDPDPVSTKYFTKLDTEVLYLVATCCDPKIFEHLKNHSVATWHCDSEEQRPLIQKIDPNYQAIGGGCTVGLRALSISIMLGYSNIHFFGFDSCLGVNDKHHAYEFQTDEEALGRIYDVKVGTDNFIPENAKIYRCAGYQLAQAWHFRDFYKMYYEYFNPTFFGDGLISAILTEIKEEIVKQEVEKVA